MNFENMRLKQIDFLLHYVPKSPSWTACNRTNHIMGIQLSGKALHDFGYQKFIMEESCVYFLNQKDDYDVQVLEKGESFSVHFTTYEPIETDSFCLKIKSAPKMIAMMERLNKLQSVSGNGENGTLSCFYEICAFLDGLRLKNYVCRDERMIRVKNHIDLHYTQNDCLKNAAADSCLSRRRFNALFKSMFDITPNRYLTARKTEYAGQLLESTDFSVSEVAEICGFRDIYYFSNVFKKEFGASPSEYRRQKKAEKGRDGI